jgi:hypothetical protein
MYGFIDPFSKIIGCREKTFSLQLRKIKPINNLDDNLEHGFIDPFSKIIGCRERGVLCKPINKNP